MPSQRHDAALSPVIGTLLLFAIVVAIAGSIWFMINRVTDDSNLEDSPEIGFSLGSNDPTVRIIQAPPEPDVLDWAEDLVLGGTCTPTLNGQPYPTGPGTPVRADDLLECEWGETLSISANEDNGNKLLFNHRFPDASST